MNLIPWVEKIKVQDKNQADFRFIDLSDPWAWAQRQVVLQVQSQISQGKPIRLIVLKARQLGISTISAAIIFNLSFIYPGLSSLIVAHNTITTQSLFEKTKLAWEYWPFNSLYTARNLSQHRILWEETHSLIRLATAGNRLSGRGLTAQCLHASEVAFWDEPLRLMSGLRNAVPSSQRSMIIIESTAFGVGGYYHDMWHDAVKGSNEFTPLFFPAHHHPEYNIYDSDLTYYDLDDREKYYHNNLNAKISFLAWRRYALINLCSSDEKVFQQEYPLTPSEAFISTGTNIFPLRKLELCYKPTHYKQGFILPTGRDYKFIAEPTRELSIFAEPRPGNEYIVAGDPTYTIEGDPACIQVINRRTFRQVAVWHGHTDAHTFATRLMEVGHYYNEALITTEIEGPGYGTIALLINSYDNDRIWRHHWADKAPGKVGQAFGWSTNYNRKNQAITTIIKLIVDGSLVIHDQETYDQLRTYVVKSDGSMGNSSTRTFDDAVMALAIGITCSIMEGPIYSEVIKHPLTNPSLDYPILPMHNQMDGQMDGQALETV